MDVDDVVDDGFDTVEEDVDGGVDEVTDIEPADDVDTTAPPSGAPGGAASMTGCRVDGAGGWPVAEAENSPG